MIIRLIIGSLFIISGGEKLINSYQNFLFVIQSYNLLPTQIEDLTARIFPWIEFLTGIFLLLGLWTKLSLRIALVLFITFLITVGQAMIRRLPVSDCGCFGELISLPLYVVFLMDIGWLALTIVALKNVQKMQKWSLDGYYSDKC
ncbi:MAG: DoxX family membrane protein [Candidatus Omnitrophica bacterium]|nr:DoxX family membrane protein [Candidatus Omnitrophota bacterium]